MTGLEPRYNVQRIGDEGGKHKECRYFVLDVDHDPLAGEALYAYALQARLGGQTELAADLLGLIGVRACKTCACTDEHGCLGGGCTWVSENECSRCRATDVHAYVVAGVTEARDQIARALARREAGVTTHLHYHHDAAPCTDRCTTYAPSEELEPATT